MKEKVAQLKEQAQSSIESAASLQELEEIRVSLLGKKGELTEISKGMKTLSPEERPVIGQLVNETREFISQILDEKNNQLKEKEKRARLEQEILDITLPGEEVELGTTHPITETMNFMKDIFIEMGLMLLMDQK